MFANTLLAATVKWNQGTFSSNGTFDLNDSANWTGGAPANGNSVFMVWTSNQNGKTQTITNAPSSTFFADSLSLTNASTANNDNVSVIVSGMAFFTNGVGQINFGGTAGSGALSLQFSSNVTFKTLTMGGSGGSGVGTLTLAGTASGNTIVFTNGVGNSFLNINGPLGLTGALIATNINATSAGTLAGNATVAQLILNNTTTNRFTISGSTTVTGAVASVVGGFTLASSGTLSLGGSGGLIISNVAPLINGTLNVSNQTLNAKTNWANSGTVLIAGGFVVGNNLTNNAGATVLGFGTLSNLLVNSGTLTVTNGTLNVTTAPVQNGIVNLESLATLNVVPAWSNTGTVNLRGGTLAGGNVTNAASGTMAGFGTLSNLAQNLGVLTASNGTLTVSGLPVQNGTVGAANNGILNYLQDWTNSGTLTNAATGTVIGGSITNAAAGTIKGGGFINPLLVNQGRMDFGGTVSNNFIQTAGSFTVSGSATITGNATISGGAVNLVGNKLTAGQFVVTGSGLLTNSVTGATLNGGITNAGTVSFFSDVFVNGPVTNTGTWFQKGVISNDVVNSGTFSLFKNSVNPLITGGILNSGSLIFDNNNSPTVNGSITNTGSVAFNAVVGGNYVQTAGSLTINQSAGNAVVKGTASISGGTFDLNGKTYSNGLMVVSGLGVLTNSVAGATFSGGLSNANVVAVTADTFFNGPITNTGSFFLQGAISNSFVNSGTVKLNNDATITGVASITAGLFNLNGMDLFNSAMSLTGGSVLTNTVAGASVNGGISNAATISVSTDTFFKGTVTNTGAFFFQGAISNNLVSSGTVFLNNNATITGTASITAGTFDLNGRILTNALMVVSGSGVLTNSVAGATLRGSANLQNAFLSGSTVTNAGILSGSGTISASLVNAAGGSLTATNGKLTVTAAPVQNGAVNVATSGKLDVAQAWQNNGTVNMLGGTLVDGDTTNTASGTVIGFGTISNLMVNLGTLTATNGTLLLAGAPVQNGAVNIATSGKLDVTQDWQNNGSINMQGGFLVDGTLTNLAGHTVTGFGTISNLLVNSGILIATNGTLNLVAKPSGNGTINIMSSGTLNVTPDWQNGGMLNLRGGTLAGGNFTNAAGSVLTGVGTISSLLVNSGTLTATNGTLTLALAPVQNGTVNIANAATLNVVPAWANSAAGTVVLGGGVLTGGTFTVDGTVSGNGTIAANLSLGAKTLTVSGGQLNLSGNTTISSGTVAGGPTRNLGTITGFGSFTGALVNDRRVNVTNGMLSVASAFTQNGTVTIAAASTLNVAPNWANAGTILMSGGILAGGTTTNNAGASLTGFGTISNQFINLGTMTATNGTLLVFDVPTQSGTINIVTTGVFQVSGALTNSGTITINSGGSLTGANIVLNTGTINANASSSISGAVIIINGGIVSGGASNAINSGTIVVNSTGVLQSQFQTALDSAVITVNTNGTLRFNVSAQNPGNAITLNSGAIVEANAALTLNSANVALPTAGLIVFNGTSGITISNAYPALTGDITFDGSNTNVTIGSIAETGGSHSLTKNGTGALNLIGADSYSGGTVVNAGTLNANATGALDSAPLTVNGGAANLNASNTMTGGATSVNGGVLNANAVGALGSGTLTMNGGTVGMNATNAYTGSADMTVGSLATLVTTVKGGTPFGAATIYNYGTLAISGVNGSMVGNTNNVVFQPGSTLFIDQTGQTNGSSYDRWGDSQAIALNGSTLMLRGIASSNAAAETVGNVSFAGGSQIALTDQGGGVSLVINSNLTRVGRATLDIDPSATLTGIVLSGSVNAARLVVNSPLATSNGMVAAYFVDVANNTFLNYVRSGSSTGLVDAVATVADIDTAVATNNVLVQGSSGNQVSHDLSLWSLRALKDIASTGGQHTITDGSGGLIIGGNFTVSPNLAFNSAEALVFVSSGNTGTLAGNISGSNGFTKFGMGNLVLSASANTFSGPTTINEGLLRVVTGGNGLANTNELTVGNAGTFDMNVNQVIGGLADLGTVTNSTAIARSLTILNTNTFVFSGTIAGPLSLTKQGLATQTLAGANSYTGQTTVAAGTLLVHGSLNNAGGTVTVNSGATLGGTGTVSRAVVVNAGGAILVNNGAAPFTLNGGSVFNSGVITANLGQLIIGGVFTNAGTFSALNGSVGTISSAMFNSGSMLLDASTLNAALSWRNTGTLNLVNGTLLGGALTNAGRVSGSGTIGSSVINNSGATITASGGGTLTLTAIPLQNGLVNILGTLNVASAWSNGNAGTVTINGGVLTGGTFTVDGAVTGNGTISANMVIGNAKTVTVNGGQMNLTALTTMGGGIINGGPGVNNFGTMSGAGTISATLANTGYIRATNGLLFVQTLAGNQAAGILEASAGATLAINGTTAWLNNGQLTVSGGTVIGGAISNNASKVISGFGTISPNVYNSGQVLVNNPGQVLTLNNSLVNLAGGVVAANTGSLAINGTFTNAGTLNMVHSVGTFSGAVVNSGAWITDPTINVFQNTYTVTSSGFIQSSAGDVYIFTNNATTAANFINVSTNKSQYDTRASDFVFANTLGLTQVFAAAGHDFGPAASMATNRIEGLNADPFSLPQYSNNFALGTLEISDFTTVRVTDAFSTLGPGTNDGFEAALYLDNLFLGSNSLLLIGSNVQLYFINSNSWSMANVQLEGNPNFDNSLNGIHQLAVIPEPSVVLLWLSGITTLCAARRRQARARQ
ncbi:MAG TPA: autotransporter-associated beta strand repeat-containing protein [Verrucomicrobiae bacterium]|nr:autotransporter-associated beta strand repeat-containing protein [Verrucomicrobiae bacterium]